MGPGKRGSVLKEQLYVEGWDGGVVPALLSTVLLNPQDSRGDYSCYFSDC